MKDGPENTRKTQELEEHFGTALTPKELAEFLKLDVRTVRKYHEDWDGIEIFPGKLMFFTNKVKERLDAKSSKKNSEGEKSVCLERQCDGQRSESTPVFRRRLKKNKTRSRKVGRGNKAGTGEVYDPFGLVDAARNGNKIS